MKKLAILLLMLASTSLVCAQPQIHKNVVERFKTNLNDNDYEQIYQMFSWKMKKSKPKEFFFNIFNRVKNEYGNLQMLKLNNYVQRSDKFRGVYDGSFDNGTLTVKITTNGSGEIIGLYILKDKNFF